MSKPAAIFLMGPTAAGKTALAVQLAQALDTEIISVDSALVFKDMNIGTAKPSLAEQGGIKHHLIDIIAPHLSFSTGAFRNQALDIMSNLHQRGKIPILVGGTMLYFNALLNGLATLPPANQEIRNNLEQDLQKFGKLAMHKKLAAIDPVAANRIHPNDPQRVQRALEVYAISGKAISDFFQDKPEFPYRAIKLIIAPQDRKILHAIIAQRFHNMLEQGLITEVEKLYQRPELHNKLPAMRTVGYRQVWSYLADEIDRETMLETAIIATRQLAKRQFTWLRKHPDALQLITAEINLFQHAFQHIKSNLST